MDKFEPAENYIKELLSVPIEIAVKNINQRLRKDPIIPGLILLVTGGQAIQTYFPNSQPLRTHDFDLKLIAPASINYTPAIRARMELLAKSIAKYIELVLNKYVGALNLDIKKEIKNKYNVDLLSKENGDIFTAATNPNTNLLNTVTFKLRDSRSTRRNAIVDVYVVDPEEISKHFNYWEFTGLKESNEILSENAGKYYIPFKVVNGIPYAGMGYIIWDTYRMVESSLKKGLRKYPRYVRKRDAIINALNNPTTKMSCNALKDYMINCAKQYNTCVINGKTLKTVNTLILYGIAEGVFPASPRFISRLKKMYDINYLCESLKRILAE